MTETCRTCGAPLGIGEYRYCTRCWTAYWNRMLEGVKLDTLGEHDEPARIDDFTAGLEEDLVAIVAELTTANRRLENENGELQRTVGNQAEVIRRQQTTIDELNDVIREHAEYAAYLEEKLEQERARADGLLERINGLSAALFAENRLLPPRLAKWNSKDGRPR